VIKIVDVGVSREVGKCSEGIFARIAMGFHKDTAEVHWDIGIFRFHGI
jgi:hypothetical protein